MVQLKVTTYEGNQKNEVASFKPSANVETPAQASGEGAKKNPW